MTESFDALWSAIVEVGRSGTTGGYHRYALTEEDHLLREWFAGEDGARGLTLTEDRMGNQWTWWGDPDERPGVVTGALPAERALGLVDCDGVTVAEALRGAGRSPDMVGPDAETVRRVGSFVELHVEQGRGLVHLGQPVGIGTHIWPHGRWRLDFPGEANHAGTTAMADRRDAMIPLAEAVLTARQAGLAEGCVATVGRIDVRPSGVNAVPGATTAWLDARGAHEEALRRTVAAVIAVADTAEGSVREESWTPVTRFDAKLIKRLQNVLPEAPQLGTGAGHDAGILANAQIPAAMIFVRNPTGISHSPAEFAERDDCTAGVEALAEVLRALTGDAG